MKILLAIMMAAALVACSKKTDTAPSAVIAEPLAKDKKAAEDAAKAMADQQKANASAAAAAASN